MFVLVRVIIVFFISSGFLLVTSDSVRCEMHDDTKRVVLVGASVGRAWDFPSLPKRMGRDDYIFEYKGKFSFDKSSVLDELLNRSEKKPDVIIIKECAAYFPGDIEKYKKIIKKQVAKIKSHDIVPILATTVPVTDPPFISMFWLKDKLKMVMPNRLRVKYRQAPVEEFNNWIIQYADEQKLEVLDLEKALRVSDKDRRLNPEYTRGDGLHLNQQAYAVLDTIIFKVLNDIHWSTE